MALSNEFLMELKSKNDVETEISRYVNLKRRGTNLIGLCPFHNEKTPSFTVYPENGSYYCFGCGVGGDVITFIRQIENLDYIEAVKTIAQRCGMQMPEEGYDDTALKIKTAVLQANRIAANMFYSCLISKEGKVARQYLLERGLTPKIIKHFGIGYAPNSWDRLISELRKHGISQEIIVKANLAGTNAKGMYDRFRDRVMFPIIDLRGNVIAFSGRVLPGNDNGGKYVNTSDTPVFKKSHNVFGLNFAKSACAERAILVEGNLDVVALHQAGFDNTIAALGTAFTVEQAKLIARYTKEVIVTFDSDTAGKRATDKVISILSAVGVKARVLRLPECKDPDEFIKKNGATRFAALIDGAIGDIDYKLYMAAENVDTSSDTGKLEYLKKATAVLAELDDEIAKDYYASKLSGEYGVAKTAILSSAKQLAKSRQKGRYKKELSEIVSTVKRDEINPEKHLHLRAARAEEVFLTILIKHPDLYSVAIEKLKVDDLVTALNKKVYSAIGYIYDNSGSVFDISLVGERFSPSEIGYISMLQASIVAGETAKAVLLDCISVILVEKRNIINDKHSDISDNEWEQRMQMLREQKIKENKF